MGLHSSWYIKNTKTLTLPSPGVPGEGKGERALLGVGDLFGGDVFVFDPVVVEGGGGAAVEAPLGAVVGGSGAEEGDSCLAFEFAAVDGEFEFTVFAGFSGG